MSLQLKFFNVPFSHLEAAEEKLSTFVKVCLSNREQGLKNKKVIIQELTLTFPVSKTGADGSRAGLPLGVDHLWVKNPQRLPPSHQ